MHTFLLILLFVPILITLYSLSFILNGKQEGSNYMSLRMDSSLTTVSFRQALALKIGKIVVAIKKKKHGGL